MQRFVHQLSSSFSLLLSREIPNRCETFFLDIQHDFCLLELALQLPILSL